MIAAREANQPPSIRARTPLNDGRAPINPPSPQILTTLRQPTANSGRPRPVSMPMAPQGYAPANDDSRATVETNGSGTNNNANGIDRRTHKPRSSNRVLGDYTLGKTLGAGSMGKVKLAYHNITSEKVRNVLLLKI